MHHHYIKQTLALGPVVSEHLPDVQPEPPHVHQEPIWSGSVTQKYSQTLVHPE